MTTCEYCGSQRVIKSGIIAGKQRYYCKKCKRYFREIVATLPACKFCASERVIKSGKVAGKQRYRCNKCGHHFREGDLRVEKFLAAKKMDKVPACKFCGSEQVVKSGIVAGKQRYLCKNCGHHYRKGDLRAENYTAVRAMCVLLHSMAKGSFRALGLMFERSHTLIYRWVREFGGSLPEPDVSGNIQFLRFDEMVDFVKSKKTSFDPLCYLTVAHGKLWPGCKAIVVLQHYKK